MQLKHTLSSEGRAWVNEVWEAVDGLCSRPIISPRLIKLGPLLSDRYAAAERLKGSEVREAFFAVITAGYASRGVLARPTNQPRLDTSSLPLDSVSDLDQGNSAMADLVEPLESLASEDFESVMALPKDLWRAYVSVATMHLQLRLESSTLTWRALSADRIEAMLRQGYVVRALDESLEREAAPRHANDTAP
jgi:hypothetical protein